MTADFQPTARVVADSISPSGARLTTMEVSLHRYVLAELNTHRMFSRNSASSRAIPVTKSIARVHAEPAVPLVWRTEQKGMQGGPPLTGDDAARARAIWLRGRDAAIAIARELSQIGVHKSIANRPMEPYMSHTVVISATHFGGFFEQRCTPDDGHALAQDEIVYPADLMRALYTEHKPQFVEDDEWHLPYVDEPEREHLTLDEQMMVSAARCARVSYLNHLGERSVESDLQLYRRLVNAHPPHASPLEHVATPATPGRPARGNFVGWRQLRHLVWSEEDQP